MLKKLLLLMVVSTASSMAAIVTFTVSLSGLNESPVNASPGIGSGTVIFDTTLNTMAINVSFSGLTGTTSNAHIHCCTTVPFTGTIGVATTTPSFVGFPLGVTSGSFISTFNLLDAASYNPTFVTANGGTAATAEAVLIAGAFAGKDYFNIHTSTVGGGEIRGFLTATPEPGTFGMLGGALAAAAFFRRKLRS